MINVQAQDSSMPLGQLHNCEEFKIPEFDDLMTRQEKVEILDSLLDDILNRTGGCERLASSSSSSESGNSGGGIVAGQLRGASEPGGTSNADKQRNAETSATASSEQAAIDSEPSENPELPQSPPLIRIAPSGSGKIPEDIPPADSDGVIARQLRKAAEAETDPKKRAKLWDKYQQFKNLPQKSASQSL